MTTLEYRYFFLFLISSSYQSEFHRLRSDSDSGVLPLLPDAAATLGENQTSVPVHEVRIEHIVVRFYFVTGNKLNSKLTSLTFISVSTVSNLMDLEVEKYMR